MAGRLKRDESVVARRAAYSRRNEEVVVGKEWSFGMEGDRRSAVILDGAAVDGAGDASDGVCRKC